MITLHEISDPHQLLAWRREVIEAVFGAPPSAELTEANADYYRRQMPLGLHRAYVALADGTEAGCGAICFSDELPSPDNPSGRCATIMNIYVRPPFREHGVAHAIVAHLVDVARAISCGKIYLETTPMARSLYTSLGFLPMEDIMKFAER